MNEDQTISSQPLRPLHRRASITASPHASTIPLTQERRRKEALELQRSRRQHAFELARRIDPLAGMDDLTLTLSDNDSDHDIELASSSIPHPHSKIHRTPKKHLYKPWAKELLMYAEQLELTRLPRGLERDWSAVVIPIGKRCLCSTFNAANGRKNTELLSRVSGRTILSTTTILPPETYLDCVYDASLGVIWIIDVIRWRTNFLVDSEQEFRAFFVSSRLSELPTQTYSQRTLSDNNSRQNLLVLPLPSYSTLSSSLFLSTIIPSLRTTSPTPFPTQVLTSIIGESENEVKIEVVRVEIPFTSNGLLLYLKSARYESGNTTLAAWISSIVPSATVHGPESIEEEQVKKETSLSRFVELIQEWDRRGGNANEVEEEDTMSDVEGMSPS